MTPALAASFVALLIACVALLVALRTRNGGGTWPVWDRDGEQR